MRPRAKKISNPISSGCGVVIFETRVQATFAAQIAASVFAPRLPARPLNILVLHGNSRPGSHEHTAEREARGGLFCD